MYQNIASGFIMGFVSPIPSFSSEDNNNYPRSYGNSIGSPREEESLEENTIANVPALVPDSNNIFHTVAQNMSAICESYLMVSGTSGNGSTLRHPYLNNIIAHPARNENGEEGGVEANSWESDGTPDEWTLGRHSNSPSESTNHYNNYPHPLNQFTHQLKNNGLSQSGLPNYAEEGDTFRRFCPIDWDQVLCWPRTPVGEVATLPCFDTLHGIPYNASGFAKRLCMEGGIWNRTEYSGCKPFTPLPNITTDTGTLDITTGIYLFGYCLSLLALIIAAVIIISFKELRCLRNTIHSHLMVTYVLADALWVLSVISTDQGRNVRHTTQATCFTFILLHYFHLTNFFWMFVEGLYLYVLVVQTFMTESIRLRTYCLIGWGLPLLVVIVWSVTKWAMLSVTTSESTERMMQVAEVEFNSVVCPWLHANHYDWIYISSALLVLAANLVFLMQIMWVLITKLRSATSQETQQSRKAAKALVVLMPLLGITYVLVLIGPKKWPLFEHTRAFLLSTQGFLVALLYCFLNAEVRMAIRHRWNRMDGWSGVKCCCCCNFDSDAASTPRLRDWSPRSRTESIRLYTPTQSQNYHTRKRESSASESTTMTVALGGCTSSFNGGGHAVTTTAGNGSTILIASMTGSSRRISTTPLHPSVFEEDCMV